MPIYRITSLKTKNTSKGDLKELDLLEEATGASYAKVAVWPDFPNFTAIVEGGDVEGTIQERQVGQYLNRSLRPVAAQRVPRAPSGIKAAQERKEVMIKQAQERKNESISYFNALNNAIAYLAAQKNSFSLEEVYAVQDKLLERWQEFETKDYTDKHEPF